MKQPPGYEALHHLNEAKAALLEERLEREIKSRQVMLAHLRAMRQQARQHRKGASR